MPHILLQLKHYCATEEMVQVFSLATSISLSLYMILAEATPTRRDLSPSQCSAASLLCCQSILPAGDPAMSQILTLLGIFVTDPAVQCALNCEPVSIVGGGPAAWSVILHVYCAYC